MSKLVDWIEISPAVSSPTPYSLAQTLRLIVAAALRRGSRTLDRIANQVAPVKAPPRDAWMLRQIEFHVEAGAVEGALYVDGQLIGHLEGVTRL